MSCITSKTVPIPVREIIQKVFKHLGYSCVLCTYTIDAESVHQIYYYCNTCALYSPGICESCAQLCHFGHTLSLPMSGLIGCSCGKSEICQAKTIKKPIPVPLRVCTTAFTPKINTAKPPRKLQAMYRCKTCWSGDTDKGVCLTCSKICHASHQVEFVNHMEGVCLCSERFYSPCLCLKAQPNLKEINEKPINVKIDNSPVKPQQEESEFIICMEKPKDSLFYKCGHIACCFEFAEQQKGHPCPICREPILDVIKFFKS